MTPDSYLDDHDELLPSTPLLDGETPFATMMGTFDDAAHELGIEPGEYAILRKPDREITVAVPVRLDDGRLSVFDGYRIQHNAGLGPFLGPLRLERRMKIDELRALAAWMTWKCALLNLPFGGAAGGIRINTTRHSAAEVERAVRRYTASLLGDIGSERDVLAPDVNSGENVMAWVMDTVSRHARFTEYAAVTGKPNALGGSVGHHDAVAQGLRGILRLAVAHRKLPSGSLRVAIQGAGTVGGNLARLLHADGHRVCGISDVHGAFYDPDGLDIPAILAWRGEYGSLRGCEGEFEKLSGEELLTRECDVLIPCAVANAVNSRNAEAVQTRLVVEGAHGPVSSQGDKILARRGIPVVPDILANGGGVVLSYFEWVQNRSGVNWPGEMVAQRLRRFMTEAWRAVVQVEREHEVRLRMAASMLAVRRVTEADKIRGVYA